MALKNSSLFEGQEKKIFLEVKFPKIDRDRSCSDQKMTIILFVRNVKVIAIS